MSFNEKVRKLLDDFLEERQDLFLIDLKISTSNEITIVIDGDEAVTLQDCLDASRAVEHNLDREEEDFSLQVTSPGLSQPLTLHRQYRKNIGRELEVILNDDSKIEGELVNGDDERITILRRYRKPKDVGKGKVDVEEEVQIQLNEIKKALVTIKF